MDLASQRALAGFVEDFHAAGGSLEDGRQWRADTDPHHVGPHQPSPQLSQNVIVSAGGRAAGRKSVPIV